MRRTGFVVMSLLSLLIAAYAISQYGFGPEGGRLTPEIQERYRSRPLSVATHIDASAVALLLGPWQFSSRVRGRWQGLGDVGPEAGLPVMSGESLLFRHLGGA